MNTLEFAINMELEGERYYSKQAELNKGNSLYSVCMLLAEDEADHARILRSKQHGKEYELKNDGALQNAKGVFNSIGDFKSEMKEMPSQLDFYRMALDKEKQSIGLYGEFLSKAAAKGDEKERLLYEYLVKQEQRHYDIINQLVMMLSHAEEWVEDPDFGLRQTFFREY